MSEQQTQKRAYNKGATNSNKAKELQRQLEIIEDKIKIQELESRKITHQRDKLEEALLKEKQNSTALARDLNKCKKDLKKSKVKINTQNNQDKKIEDLEKKLERASKWCDCMEQEMDQFYLYAEYIGENWSSRKTSDVDLGRVVHDLTVCVRSSIISLDPLNKCGTDIPYNEPAWLSQRRAKRSLAKVQEKVKR